MDGTKGGTTKPTTAHAKAFNATLKAAGKADVIEPTLEELALVASYEVLGKCFDLTPDSTIEEVQEKRREILEDKARNKETMSKWMSADKDDEYCINSVKTIGAMRTQFILLVERYAVYHNIVAKDFVFDQLLVPARQRSSSK